VGQRAVVLDVGKRYIPTKTRSPHAVRAVGDLQGDREGSTCRLQINGYGRGDSPRGVDEGTAIPGIGRATRIMRSGGGQLREALLSYETCEREYEPPDRAWNSNAFYVERAARDR